MRTELSTLASNSVKNIYIFIADSVRADAIPARLRSEALFGSCISPSTWTAASMPSILSGRYPAEVGITEFGSQLPHPSPLFDCERSASLAAPTIWTGLEPGEKPPQTLLHTTDYRSLEELEPPFVHVEHDKGGHAPYGYSFEECPSEEMIFTEYNASLNDVPTLYQDSIRSSINRFLDRCDYLREEGILEDTLVIFTSDHGELLGRESEACIVDHVHPLVPELVEVPLLFMGAGLPSHESLTGIYSGVDIVPTALGALNDPVPELVDGLDAWSNVPSPTRTVRSEVVRSASVFDRNLTVYRARSVWDECGGRVYQDGNDLLRLGYGAIANYLQGTTSRQSLRGLTTTALKEFAHIYRRSQRSYGDPQFCWDTVDDVIPDDFTTSPVSYSDDNLQEQLESLGYL